MKNKKNTLIALSISLQLFTSQSTYMLPTVPVLFTLLQEYSAPLTYMYVLEMANREITADMLFSSLTKNLPEDSNKTRLRACLVLAILQKATPCPIQQNPPVIVYHQSKKHKIHPKRPFL